MMYKSVATTKVSNRYSSLGEKGHDDDNDGNMTSVPISDFIRPDSKRKLKRTRQLINKKEREFTVCADGCHCGDHREEEFPGLPETVVWGQPERVKGSSTEEDTPPRCETVAWGQSKRAKGSSTKDKETAHCEQGGEKTDVDPNVKEMIETYEDKVAKYTKQPVMNRWKRA